MSVEMKFFTATVLFAFSVAAQSHGQEAPPQNTASRADASVPTLKLSTQLVTLDATVFDKQGRIVTTPLSREDFLVEEDRRVQLIRNFEAASEHFAVASDAATDKMPRTIVVLDELNSRYLPARGSSGNILELADQQAYLREELIAFLQRQPVQLETMVEVLALTHHGYVVVVPSTRDRETSIAGLRSHNPGLGTPFRDFIEETGAGGSADHTLTKGSMAALWSLALAERSLPGRKNVLWLGWGGPNQVGGTRVDPEKLSSGERYYREIIDLLVASRITLNVFGPGGGAGDVEPTSIAYRSQSYRFESDFGFAGFVAATGGQVGNGNDVSGELQTSSNYNAYYYTLSYRPDPLNFDGRFRRIRVTVKGHPDWTVLTKAGYYASQFGGEKDPAHELQSDLSIAAFEAMPFDAIRATLNSVERERGSDRVRFTLEINSADLEWHTSDAGRDTDLAVAVAALGSVFAKAPLHSQVGIWHFKTTADPRDSGLRTAVAVTGVIPAKAKRIRLVLRDMANGRMGTLDVPLSAIESAPQVEFLPSGLLSPPVLLKR